MFCPPIYLHSQSGGQYPGILPGRNNSHFIFKFLPLYANTSWEYSSRFKEVLKTEGEARGFQHFPADIKSVTSLLVPFLKQYQFSNKIQFKLEYERGVFRDIAVRRFKEVLKTEGEARGFQHFPADIKSVTSLLVPFLKQYQFSNKNLFKKNTSGEYSWMLPSGGLKKCWKPRAKPEVFNTSLLTLRVWLASWYHFSNSTNSRTKSV